MSCFSFKYICLSLFDMFFSPAMSCWCEPLDASSLPRPQKRPCPRQSQTPRCGTHGVIPCPAWFVHGGPCHAIWDRLQSAWETHAMGHVSMWNNAVPSSNASNTRSAQATTSLFDDKPQAEAGESPGVCACWTVGKMYCTTKLYIHQCPRTLKAGCFLVCFRQWKSVLLGERECQWEFHSNYSPLGFICSDSRMLLLFASSFVPYSYAFIAIAA